MSLTRQPAATRVIHVRDYGALGNGVADDTAAILRARTALVALGGNGVLYFSQGTYLCSATLLRTNGMLFAGDGTGVSTLKYTGAGTAIAPLTPGARSYRGGLRNLSLTTTTGAIGVDLDSVSIAHFDHVEVLGFSEKGFWLHSAISGGCVYNRFDDCLVQTPAMPNSAVSYQIDALSTNANVFDKCRSNLANVGWRVEDSNDNTMAFCQAEGGGTGFYLTASAPGLADDNRLIGCRAENNTVYGFDIASPNVRDTHIPFHWVGSNGVADFHDLGTRTYYDPQLSVTVTGALATLRNFLSPSIGLSSPSGAYQAATATAMYLRGNTPDGAGNVGVWIGNNPPLTDPTVRIAGFCRDTPVGHTQPASYIRQDGAYEHADTGILVIPGTGLPEGVVTAPAGSLFLSGDGMYFKASGAGNTGWAVK